jgi:HEAT repeat protein
MANSVVLTSGREMKINIKVLLLISLILLTIILFFSKSKSIIESEDRAASASLTNEVSEFLDSRSELGRRLGRDTPYLSENEGSVARKALSEADFRDLAESLGNYAVFDRNMAINKFKEHALDKESLDAIFSGLGRLSSDHTSFSTLVAALAAVGTPEIQERLRYLLEQRDSDWRAFAAIIPAFAFLQQPTPQTIEFLFERSRHPDPDFSSTAALALGAVVRTLRVKGETSGTTLLQLQIDKIKDPSSRVEDVRGALAVLGNAGLPETEELIVSLLSTDDPSLRADAALALRFMSSSSSEKALLARLEIEEDLDTRMTIIEALLHRPVSALGLAAIRTLMSAVPPAPHELREKALELFFHSELSESEKIMNSEWLKSMIAAEPASSVKKKMNDTLQMLSRPSYQ